MSGKVGDNLFRASGVIAAAAGGGVSWQDVETGATFTAVAGNGYPVNTTSNACTVTLPASASVGDEIIFTDYARNWDTNALTINQNSLNYQGNATPNPVYDTAGESIHIVYMDATKGWVPTYDGAVAMETTQNVDHEYLVIAGGGAGGDAANTSGYGRGGGAAGGMLSNYGGTAIELTPGTTYTITVGTGGVVVDGNQGGAGVNSSISGTGLTTITATGGGGGGSDSGATKGGGAGGSGGGGGSQDGTGGSATVSPSQGNDGGDGDTDAGGGGGGAGAVGANIPSAGNGGNGGAGLANSITGSSVTYAGGGGGGGNAPGAGGSGGGGTGFDYSTAAATAGTDGLGGGGGGGGHLSHALEAAADGGNGRIILRVATADKGTPSGEDSSAVDGSDTVITWLATGSYVA